VVSRTKISVLSILTIYYTYYCFISCKKRLSVIADYRVGHLYGYGLGLLNHLEMRPFLVISTSLSSIKHVKSLSSLIDISEIKMPGKRHQIQGI
jgi:hypothetical protein